ncbi:unnamed protein product [Alternaria alternata]
MALFAFLQSVDHCLILPIEKGLESTIVDPDTLSAEKQQELWERLLVSIEKNDPIGLRICLRGGAPLLHEDGMKESLLHRAARHGNQDLLVELCNREEQRNLFKDLASPNARKETPLFYAVRSQNGVAVRFFLKQYNLYGREIDPYGEFLSGDRESTFKDAILSNHRETVEPYLNNDIWPQWQDVYIADRDRGGMDVQLSALAFAYNQEKRSVAELLIEQGGSMRPIDTCIIYQEDIVHLADLVDNTKVLERWIFKDVSQGLSREALPSVLHPWIECVARLYPSLKFGDKILNAVLRHVHETAMVLYYHVKEIGDLDVIEHLVQVIGFTRNYDDLYLVAIEADDNQSNGTQREALLTLKDVKFRRPRTQEQGRADHRAVEKLLEDAQNKEAHEFSFEAHYEECERSMNVQPPEINPQRATQLAENIASITSRINAVSKGGKQSNKCKQLAEQIPNLWCVSSVDSEKKANELEKGRKVLIEKDGDKVEGKLRVKVQVNTSDKCPHLQLSGLMTIGAIARSKETTAENENEDFVTLKETRDQVIKELGWGEEQLELSMGMSADFEGAVKMGSDEVRVGSQIFGERPQKKDAVIKEKEAQEKS